MVDNELEAKVRKVIEEVYCCTCTTPIKAKVVDNAYIVNLYFRSTEWSPLQIIWEGNSEEDFLNWLKIDLKHRNLLRSSFIKIEVQNELQL